MFQSTAMVMLGQKQHIACHQCVCTTEVGNDLFKTITETIVFKALVDIRRI